MHKSVHNLCKSKIFGVRHVMGLEEWDQFHFWPYTPKNCHFYGVIHTIWFSEGLHPINVFFCEYIITWTTNRCHSEKNWKRKLEPQEMTSGSAIWWPKSIFYITPSISAIMCIYMPNFIKIQKLSFLATKC